MTPGRRPLIGATKILRGLSADNWTPAATDPGRTLIAETRARRDGARGIGVEPRTRVGRRPPSGSREDGLACDFGGSVKPSLPDLVVDDPGAVRCMPCSDFASVWPHGREDAVAGGGRDQDIPGCADRRTTIRRVF